MQEGCPTLQLLAPSSSRPGIYVLSGGWVMDLAVRVQHKECWQKRLQRANIRQGWGEGQTQVSRPASRAVTRKQTTPGTHHSSQILSVPRTEHHCGPISALNTTWAMGDGICRGPPLSFSLGSEPLSFSPGSEPLPAGPQVPMVLVTRSQGDGKHYKSIRCPDPSEYLYYFVACQI